MIFETRCRHRNLKAISGLRACGAMPVSQSTSRGHIGMLNGKLSAVRWVSGDEWDMQDI
jgi:hypothetical protein